MSLFLLISIGSVCASDSDLADQSVLTYDENSDALSVESEIDDAILSTDNDETLLKDSSEPIVTAAQTSADVNSSKIVEVKINISGDVNVNDLKPTVTYTQNNTTKTIGTSDYKLTNNTYSFKLNEANFKTASLALAYKGEIINNITLNRIYNVDFQVVNDLCEYRTGFFTFRVVDRDENNKALSDVDVTLTTTGNIKAGFSAKTDKDGIASFDADKLYEFSQDTTLSMKYLSAGYHNVTLSTKDNIKSTTKTVRLGVSKGNVKLKVDPYNEPYGSEKNVTVTATKSDGNPLTNEVIYLSMPQTTAKNYYFSTDSNGQCKINVKNLIPGTYSYKVACNNTASITLNPVSGTITVQKARVEITVEPKNIYYNSDPTAIVKVKYEKTGNDAANAIIKITAYETDGSSTLYRVQTNENGTVAVSIPLSVGKHKLVVGIAESEYEPRYLAYDKTAFVTVSYANAKFEAPKVTAYYKDDSTFNIRVVNLKNGNGMYQTKVTFNVYPPSSTGYLSYSASTDADGYIKLPLKDFEPGTYKVEIMDGDTKNYGSSSITSQFVIKTRTATTLTVTDVTAYYKENKYIIATLKDKNNKPVSGVKIGFANNGVTYVTTDSNGKARFYTNELLPGTYSITAKFFGDDNYDVSNKAVSKVVITKAPTKLTAQYDADSKNIVATVTDTNGKPLSGLKVGFNIDGVKYVTTDANGQAKYSTASLANNSYSVEVMAYGNETYENSNKETVSFAIGDKLLAKIFLRNALYFVTETKMVKVTLWDGLNKPLAGKTVHIQVYDSKYSGVTDENGDALIRVGVGFGVHNATVSFDGDDQYYATSKVGNIRVIKETPSVMIRGADSQFKVSDKPKTVKVYLWDRTSTPLPVGSKIAIKVNGETFIGYTDSEGIANIEVTNIDHAGTFNAQAVFAGNSAYNAVTKNFKITVR